jgi:hypothetical protein
MIAIVWLVAAGISLPPLLGWSHPQQEGDFPQCEVSRPEFSSADSSRDAGDIIRGNKTHMLTLDLSDFSPNAAIP